MALTDERCVPCREGASRVEGAELERLLKEIPLWRVAPRNGVPAIEREFQFPDFSKALAFTVEVGLIAEREDHHPAIVTEWGRVSVAFWTHKIRGLHRNDFVAAAKVDGLAA